MRQLRAGVDLRHPPLAPRQRSQRREAHCQGDQHGAVAGAGGWQRGAGPCGRAGSAVALHASAPAACGRCRRPGGHVGLGARRRGRRGRSSAMFTPAPVALGEPQPAPPAGGRRDEPQARGVDEPADHAGHPLATSHSPAARRRAPSRRRTRRGEPEEAGASRASSPTSAAAPSRPAPPRAASPPGRLAQPRMRPPRRRRRTARVPSAVTASCSQAAAAAPARPAAARGRRQQHGHQEVDEQRGHRPRHQQRGEPLQRVRLARGEASGSSACTSGAPATISTASAGAAISIA